MITVSNFVRLYLPILKHSAQLLSWVPSFSSTSVFQLFFNRLESFSALLCCDTGVRSVPNGQKYPFYVLSYAQKPLIDTGSICVTLYL